MRPSGRRQRRGRRDRGHRGARSPPRRPCCPARPALRRRGHLSAGPAGAAQTGDRPSWRPTRLRDRPASCSAIFLSCCAAGESGRRDHDRRRRCRPPRAAACRSGSRPAAAPARPVAWSACPRPPGRRPCRTPRPARRSAGRAGRTCSRSRRPPAGAAARPATPARSATSDAASCGVVTTISSRAGHQVRGRDRHVAGAGRQVHQQDVQVAPVHVGQELRAAAGAGSGRAAAAARCPSSASRWRWPRPRAPSAA